MPRIFISYRRGDTAYVSQQISTALKKQFGEESVFIDTSAIEPAADFQKTINEELKHTDVILAVIGDRWIEARSEDGKRRLDNPLDLVRIEISTALTLGIPVLPVITEKVTLSALKPKLPTDLVNLTRLNGLPVRAGRDLENDLRALVDGIKSILLPRLTASELLLPSAVKVRPPGLRSFDERDEGFFHCLLPDATQEQLKFWKKHIEATDGVTLRVGVIYGPSGCGKTSIVKAGLIPHLASHVSCIRVEATADSTEAALLTALQAKYKHLSAHSSLKAALRDNQKPSKVLLVIDQFEQYLHSVSDDDQGSLAEALRQCDGLHFQCLLMIRDDFLTPISRFMDRLQMPLRGNEYIGVVDLFNARHAKKVLALLGQAYGGLPLLLNDGKFAEAQNDFLNQAISELRERDLVIPVRLALLAQMFERKQWTPDSLSDIGGVSGVVGAFLEDSLVAKTASDSNSQRQVAAQQILAALLPAPDTTIKGAMRTKEQLFRQSGYRGHEREFGKVLDLLVAKLRLVTPTVRVIESIDGTANGLVNEECYQLTHDYLVPSLREWLARKQRETPQGRAELLLDDRAEEWNARPEDRRLPSLWQWLNIRRHVPKKSWRPPQQRMMERATRVHVKTVAALILLLSIATIASVITRSQVIHQHNATHAAGLVRAILNAETAQVPPIISEMGKYRKWTDPLLRREYDNAAANSRQKLHSGLALLSVDSTKVDYLYARLLDAKAEDVPVIADALIPHKDTLIVKLWLVVNHPEPSKESQRLRAAAALATYAVGDKAWETAGNLVVDDLVRENPIFLEHWSKALVSVKMSLFERLTHFYREHQPERAAERRLATSLLCIYAADDPNRLAELVMDADDRQFADIFSVFQQHRERDLSIFEREAKKELPYDSPLSNESAENQEKRLTDREKLAKRKANAAVALILNDQAHSTWSLLAFHPKNGEPSTSDPRTRSYLVHKLSTFGANPQKIIQRLRDESDATVVRALLLSLGEFDEKRLPWNERIKVISVVQEMYQSRTDAGVHGAAEWLLRKWKQDEWLKQIQNQFKDESRLASIQEQLASRTTSNSGVAPQWYVNSQGQTMVVVSGPVEFMMGSPDSEIGRDTNEHQYKRRIGRNFAVSSTPVTMQQYRQYVPDFHVGEPPELPAFGTSWFQAAEYCNFLSRKEHLIECYQIADECDEHGIRATVLKEDYLTLNGYRLPTEAEMEYINRAEASTSRYFGETDELLANYAWKSKELQLVGMRKPNDFGLFDVLGSAHLWTQDAVNEYLDPPRGIAIDDHQVPVLAVDIATNRVLRGGSYLSPLPSFIRSAYRCDLTPVSNGGDLGFRLARTISTVPWSRSATATDVGGQDRGILEFPKLSAESDWPWWRGPTRNGIAGERPVPTKLSETNNLLWKVPVPGRGHSSPIVVGDRIFLETADEKAKIQSVLAFDRSTGKQLWQKNVNHEKFPSEIWPTNTHASSTVASDGERIFATFLNNEQIQAVALDLDGEIVWNNKVCSFHPKRHQWGYGASPMIYGDVVIISAEYDGEDSCITALDRKTGEQVWRTPRPPNISFSSPVIAHICGRDQMLISGAQMVVSYDPETGLGRWATRGSSFITAGTLVWDADIVFAGGGDPKSETLAVKGDGSGIVLWRNTARCDAQSMLACNGYLYGFTDEESKNGGIIHCWRGTDGMLMWRKRLQGPVSASPVLAGGHIYWANERGTMYVFRPNPEEYDDVAENQIGSESFASPAISNGRIFLRVADTSDGSREEFLYCFGTKE